jgi:uroporphyrinogen decarboxylase
LITIELDPPKGAGAAYRNVTDSGWDEVNEATGTWAKYIFDSDSDTELEVDSWIKQGEFEALERHADLLEDAGCGVDESRFDSTKYIIEKNKKQRAVMVKIPNLIPTGLSWTPLFFESMHIRPELAQRLCDAYLKKGLALAEYMITLGADVLLVCSDWAYNSGPMASPAMIREYWIPQIRAVADLCHSNGVFLMKHTDGNIMSFIDDFMTMGIDAYQGIEPNAGMSLKTVKDLYGDRVLLMGNVDCAQTLPFGTKEQIVEETKNCLRDGGPGGGYILASCNTIQTCVPADNYLTMIEAAHKFNRYPIMI